MQYILSLFTVLFIFIGCSSADKDLLSESDTSHLTENQKLDLFFEKSFNEWVETSPEWQTYLGLKTNYGALDDESQEQERKVLEITKRQLKELKKFDFDKLDEFHQVSYRIFKQGGEEDVEDFQYKRYRYPFNQMFGVQSEMPSFMMNMHRIDNESDAKAYVDRLNKFKQKFAQVLVNVKASSKVGVVPPLFVYAKVIQDSQNIIKGRPFTDDKDDSPLLADFRQKLDKLKEVSPVQKKALLVSAEEALLNSVKPAYDNLIVEIKDLEKKADDRAGVWKFPKGEAYYKTRLKRITTTDMTADEIHDLGLAEVERIHSEMRNIMKVVKFKGDLNDFFEFMKNDKRFYYPDNKAGRKRYLADSNKIISDMKAQLKGLFKTMPKAELLVKPVEAYREKSAGLAFYQGPPMEGSRPGIYYVNLYDMKAVSKYEMEALAYHEAIPGHHMQISIAKEMEELPKFRKFAGGFTAFTEGWGLYAELVPKELGFYKDPYSDFGRLSMELWRACRLVVDTGIHDKRWTREQAITYLDQNTPSMNADNIKAIERYIVMPGQATAYKVGMLKILQLREMSKQELGKDFDIRNFHDQVLRSGSLPLNILEENIHKWIKLTKAPALREPAKTSIE